MTEKELRRGGGNQATKLEVTTPTQFQKNFKYLNRELPDGRKFS